MGPAQDHRACRWSDGAGGRRDDADRWRITTGIPKTSCCSRAADELHTDSKLSDATWNALAERYNKKQLIELVMLVGQYHLVAMTLNSLGVERDAGVEGFPS